jgi:phosphohistidine phosphatase
MRRDLSMDLWIVRHADSAPVSAGLRDFDRPLTARGVADCARMRATLERLAPHADRIVASDARRARTTAELLAPAFERKAEAIELDHRIYEAALDTLLELVRETAADVASLVIVGHNPGVSELAAHVLTHDWRRGLPPLGILRARLDGPWSDFGARSATFDRYLDPTTLD